MFFNSLIFLVFSDFEELKTGKGRLGNYLWNERCLTLEAKTLLSRVFYWRCDDLWSL